MTAAVIYPDDYDTDRPDPAEIAEIEAEANAARNARIRAHNRWCAENPEQAKALWDKANQDSIEQGCGPLPF